MERESYNNIAILRIFRSNGEGCYALEEWKPEKGPWTKHIQTLFPPSPLFFLQQISFLARLLSGDLVRSRIIIRIVLLKAS